MGVTNPTKETGTGVLLDSEKRRGCLSSVPTAQRRLVAACSMIGCRYLEIEQIAN